MSKFQVKCSCIKCKAETTTAQLKRNHINGCPSKKLPKKTGAWNKGLTKDTDIRVKNHSLSLIGRVLGKAKTAEAEEERKSKISDYAKSSGFGGYRENAGRSKKFKVVDSFGKETTLQSSFELQCSELLNEMNIRWLRPKSLKYNGRNYFADFYLPDFDIWLDPKNSYKAKQDADKISAVIEQNHVKLYVLLEEQITKEYVASLIQW